MDFSVKKFRECLGMFSTGICIASTRSKMGKKEALTINSFASVSLEPPLILFCIDNFSSCLNAFLENDFFAISILEANQQIIAHRFSLPSIDKWEGINFELGKTGSPIIKPNLSFLECERHATYKAGDHHIIIGKVIALETPTKNNLNPLIYFKGNYHHSPELLKL